MPKRRVSKPRATPKPSSRPSWQDAISFAARAHRNQVRRDARTPYVAHPCRVMMIVRHAFGCDDDAILCAAALHDTIEDTTTDYNDLLDRFGEQVADLVATLTKNMALPENLRERLYDDQLEHADPGARLIKLADVYDNLCDLETLEGSTVADRRRKAIEKARRALALISKDDSPEARRGMELVRAKIKSSSRVR
jgi:guanosine-3',5'-bis(diphosphate) 3'-pyrophosphohydrolase